MASLSLGMPPPNYLPPTLPTFPGQVPTSTPYGTFVPPDPTQVGNDPAFQRRLQLGQQALERSAAARGTLLSGGTAKALSDYAQGAASDEYDKIYGRARDAYALNRDTNQQNFGQSLASYHGGLEGFTANTAAGLGYGRLGLDAARTGGYAMPGGGSGDDFSGWIAANRANGNVAGVNLAMPGQSLPQVGARRYPGASAPRQGYR